MSSRPMMSNQQAASSRPTISLCIIAKNEEAWLQQCIDSVRDVVDEIIVVDNESSDRTAAIAQENGAVVVSCPAKDDFSALRNEGIKNATKDWVLMLDADEAISKKDHSKILAAVARTVDGYFLIQRNYTLPVSKPDSPAASQGTLTQEWVPNDQFYEEGKQFSGFRPNPILRLFRNKKEYSFRYRVHEDVYPSIEEHGGKAEIINIVIHHFNALKPQERRAASLERYHHLIELQAKEYPDDLTALQYLAMMHLSRRETDKALAAFESIIRRDPFHGIAHKCLGALYAQKAGMETGKGTMTEAKEGTRTEAEMKAAAQDRKKAMEHFAKAIKLIPKDPDAYLDLALLCHQDGNTRHAIKILGMATRERINSPAVYNMLGVLLLETNNLDEAVKTLEYANEAFSSYAAAPTIINNLFSAYLQQGEGDKAIALLEGAIASMPIVESFHQNLLQLYRQTGQHEKADALEKKTQKHEAAKR